MKNASASYVKRILPRERCDGKLATLPIEKLPLGEVTFPRGWLRAQMDLMCEGITGRLPEYGPFFRPERDGFLNPEVANGWEEIPYWIRGFYPMAILSENKKHIATAERYFEALFASRGEDGWFGPAYLKEYDVLENGLVLSDLFPAMMLLDAMILYYEKTGDGRVLDTMEGFFGFCQRIPDKAFLPARTDRLRWQKVRGGDMLTPIYWYYRKTGQEWVLELARRFYDKIWKSSMEFVAHHAVDFGQRVGYDAVYSQQSQDAADFARSEEAYLHFQEVWGQTPRGIFCADEQIRAGATDPRQGYEPCGMVELTKTFYEMGRISGDTLYADRTEDVMLNHFAPSFSPDYQQMHYLTSSNLPILSDWREEPSCNGSWIRGKSHEIFTPNNRCCGHNTGMGWPWYAMNTWQRTADGGLVAWLYSESRVDTMLGGERASFVCSTEYPFDNTVKLCIEAWPTKAEAPLYFRLPAWNEAAVVLLNGKELSRTTESGGFLRVSAELAAGDELLIRLGASLKLTTWKNNGSVSVDLGPLTYSVRIPECWRVIEDAGIYNHPTPHLFENYEVLPRANWNYGLCLENGDVSSCVSFKARFPLAHQPWSEENAPIVLRARVRRIPEWGLEDDMAGELQQSPAYTDFEEEEIELIPLGCARLRMSCLPIATTDREKGIQWKRTPLHTDLSLRPKRYPDPYLGGAPKGAIPD